MHYGKALPPVTALKVYVNPMLSATGRYDFRITSGVFGIGSSPMT